MAMNLFRYCVTVILLAVMGCGKGEPVPETVAVTGTVTYQSKPVEGAQVIFNSSDPKLKPASGVTDAQGKFSVQTYVSPTTQARGVMPGNYKVTVSKIEKSTMSSEEMMKASSGQQPVGPKHLLPERYSSPQKTDLVADVKKGDSTPFEYELKD